MHRESNLVRASFRQCMQMENERSNTSSYVVNGIPNKITYIPNFITDAEEKYILHEVNSVAKPKWTQLRNRRLQNWGGLPHQKGMVPEKLPEWLDKYNRKIASLGVFGEKIPNHVLVNEYHPGQGIMPHLDGPLYYPTVTTITLGSHAVLEFYHPLDDDTSNDYEADQDCAGLSSSFEDRHFASILLERRSLVVVQEDMYNTYLHGIQEIKEDVVSDKIANLTLTSADLGDILSRGTRVSLTVRHVPKVLKAKFLLGKR